MSEASKNLAVIQVGVVTSKEADTQGNFPVILNPVAGSVPYAQMRNGTIANSVGWTAGTTHLVMWREDAPHEEYGRQFTYVELANLSNQAETILSWMDKLGQGHVIPKEQYGDLEVSGSNDGEIPDQD